MSNQQPFPRRGPALPSIPKGEVLGTYETYPEAQQIVDKLAHADFDVSQLAIIGSDLKTVERVTGKLTYGRAAAGGAATGAWFGLFGGVLLFLVSSSPNPAYAVAAIFIGAGFGMLFGVVTYTINRRRRDFTSTHQVIASSYQVIAPAGQVVRAQELLERSEHQ
ncbi:MAG TPA: general stress protein [Galbitalea sp.]